jgi:branched-chain amino acid transport system permease protein
MFGLYVILAMSLNLLVGYTGMLSLCHAAFYAIGAYSSSLLMIKMGWSTIPSLLASLVLSSVVAYVLAVLSLRFHDDFFVLATIGYQVIVFSVLYNWVSLTNGPYGVLGIPRPTLFGWSLTSVGDFLLVVIATALLVGALLWHLSTSAYGRTLQAIRDDEVGALSLGKDVQWFKRSAFVIAAILAALPGVWFAGYATYIDPAGFTTDEAIFILCAVVIGGAGNLRGPVIGALIVVVLPELFRFLPLSTATSANVRQSMWGVLLVLIMRFRPQGVAGRYAID